MATIIEIPNGQCGYHQVLAQVRKNGRKRSPRGVPTYDLGHTTIVMDPERALPIDTGRGIKPAIAAVETLQFIAAQMDPSLIRRIEPNFSKFNERDGTFHGAYGIRVGDQMHHVVDKLTQDPDTRRAVVTLWNPTLDNLEGKSDYPCTVALGFDITDDHLNAHTVMRSNDAWLGAPYDWHTFTQVQMTLADSLDILPGTYTHTAWSFHLYEKDIGPSEHVTDASIQQYLPDGLSISSWHENVTIAQSILRGSNKALLTKSERWYGEQLSPYVG